MILRFTFPVAIFIRTTFIISTLPFLFALERNELDKFSDRSVADNKPKMITQNFSNNTENVLRYNRQLDTEIENRFHINVNMIIRTGESKVLGAKYINETVLPTNHDCLIWCLETPTCNAVVFEEKMVRSCYMFNCGSPDSFLCKFTKHNFFKSSVLKVSQHSYELSQWGNQVKHEKELADLRDADITSIAPPELKTPPTTSNGSSNITKPASDADITSIAPPELKTPPITSNGSSNITKPGRKCHHYQFQCVNNSECIAIYNVCDGIPQCADESDESPDLKCHMKDAKDVGPLLKPPAEQPPPDTPDSYSTTEMKTPSSTAMHGSPHLHQPANKPNGQQMKSGRMEKPKSIWPDARLADSQVSNTDYYHRTDESDGLGSPFIHKHSQFVAANDARGRWPNDYDPPHSSGEQQYNPYEGGRADDQYLPNPMEYDGVKGYYRQEETPYWPNQDTAQDGTYPMDEFPPSGIHGLSKSNSYPDKDSLYPQQLSRNAGRYPEHRTIHKTLDGPAVQKNRAADVDEYKSRRFPLQRPSYMAYEEALQKQLAAGYGDVKPKHYEPNMEDSMYTNSNDDMLRASLVNQMPMELERSHPYQYEKHLEQSEPPENKGQINHEKETKKVSSKGTAKPVTRPPRQKTVFDFKMSVQELYQASRTHSQEANSAILALVMGLTITILLVVFLSCRIKTIRKRMSRKGRALAHDADYLVNGMYL